MSRIQPWILELHASAQLSDATYAALHEHFDDAQLLELVMLAGLYHAVSFVVNAAQVQPESWAPRFDTG